MPRIPMFLYGEKFWKEVINLELLAEYKLIDAEDLALYHIVDSVNEAWLELEPILIEIKEFNRA
jgi:predicted Rossmann-fold nucleotide-binding protein